MGCKKLNNFISNNLTNLIRTNTISIYKKLIDIPFYDNHIIDVNSYIFADIAQLLYSSKNKNIYIIDRINSIQMFINKFSKLIKNNPNSIFHLVFDHYDNNYKINNDVIIEKINNTFSLNLSIGDLNNINVASIKNEERSKRQNNNSSNKKINNITNIFNELKKNNIVNGEITDQIININILNCFTFYNYLVIKYIFSDIPNVKLYNSSFEADITIGSLINKYINQKNIIYSNDSDMIIYSKGCDILRKFKFNINNFNNPKYHYILHTQKFYKDYLYLDSNKVCLLPVLLECDYINNGCYKNIIECSENIRSIRVNDLIKIIPQTNLIKTLYCYIIFNNPELFDNLDCRWNKEWNIYYDYLFVINSIKIKFKYCSYYYLNEYNIESIYKEFNYINDIKIKLNNLFNILEDINEINKINNTNNTNIINSINIMENINVEKYKNIVENICSNINNISSINLYQYSKDTYIENIDDIINQIEDIKPFYLLKLIEKINLNETEKNISDKIILEQKNRYLN